MPQDFLNGIDMNSTAIENLAAPTNANDAARKVDIDSAIEGTAWKDACVVGTQGNLNLASPGTSIDGITMAQGDRVLVKAQTAGEENGIYVYDTDTTAMVRSDDCSTSDELEQAVTTVEEGTDAGSSFRQTTVNFVLETGTVTWTAFGTAVPSASPTTEGKIELATQAEVDAGTDTLRAVTPDTLANYSGLVEKHEALIGDNAATQIDVTHNHGTRDVVVQVYRNSTPWDNVICDISRPDTNTVRLNFAVAPTTDQFRVVIRS